MDEATVGAANVSKTGRQCTPFPSSSHSAGSTLTPATSPALHDAWIEWEERVLRPSVLDGGDVLAGAAATLAPAVDGGAHLGGGRAPAFADVVVACTLLSVDQVSGRERVCGCDRGLEWGGIISP